MFSDPWLDDPGYGNRVDVVYSSTPSPAILIVTAVNERHGFSAVDPDSV
jgi:hypothetical protein